jgi:plasmid stability protein
MAQMIIRNIPAEVLDAFKDLARRRGRSQEEEARRLIEEAVREDRAWIEFARQSDAALENYQAEGRTFSDSTELLRRMREER